MHVTWTSSMLAVIAALQVAAGAAQAEARGASIGLDGGPWQYATIAPWSPAATDGDALFHSGPSTTRFKDKGAAGDFESV